jgi:hypothetical protein
MTESNEQTEENKVKYKPTGLPLVRPDNWRDAAEFALNLEKKNGKNIAETTRNAIPDVFVSDGPKELSTKAVYERLKSMKRDYLEEKLRVEAKLKEFGEVYDVESEVTVNSISLSRWLELSVRLDAKPVRGKKFPKFIMDKLVKWADSITDRRTVSHLILQDRIAQLVYEECDDHFKLLPVTFGGLEKPTTMGVQWIRDNLKLACHESKELKPKSISHWQKIRSDLLDDKRRNDCLNNCNDDDHQRRQLHQQQLEYQQSLNYPPSAYNNDSSLFSDEELSIDMPVRSEVLPFVTQQHQFPVSSMFYPHHSILTNNPMGSSAFQTHQMNNDTTQSMWGGGGVLLFTGINNNLSQITHNQLHH